MKNKYYAVVDGKEELVRTTSHEYGYMCLKTNQCAKTREELVKRIHSNCYSVANEYKRHPMNARTGYDLYTRKYFTRTPEQIKEFFKLLNENAENDYQESLKTIVELYTK